MNDHITKEQFWLEFFGNFGRDFLVEGGRRFTNCPTDILQYIKDCSERKRPAFVSAQPEITQSKPFGIEKVFFDFDYGKKSDNLSQVEIESRKSEMAKEVIDFLKGLSKLNIRPLVVKTNKGYHVYIYFDKVYKIDSKVDFWKEVYGIISFKLLRSHSLYADKNVLRDLVRLCRIPMSVHEASGQECIILNNKLEPDKIRSIEYYRLYGLKQSDLEYAIKQVKSHKKTTSRSQLTICPSNYQSNRKLRPCFQKAIDAHEMCHAQRLALLLEAYCAGYKDPDSMVDIFRYFNDFNESKTHYQVDYFFKNNVNKGQVRPYRCGKIAEKGWCLGESCPLFEKNIQKTLQTKSY